MSCADYESEYCKDGPCCKNGNVLPGAEVILGQNQNFPEENCCSCGRSAGK